MNGLRTFLCCLACLTITRVGWAQPNVQLTQYMFSGLVINPAYAGAEEALSCTFIQRRQWAGFPGAPETQTLSAHSLFAKKHIGLGILAVHDKIGVHQNISALSNYAYHIPVGMNSTLSMGLQAGLRSMRSDYASLSAGGNDPKLAATFISETFFDVGAGLYLRTPRFQAGLSSLDLIPKRLWVNDTTRVHLRQSNTLIFFRYSIPVNDVFDIEPAVLVKYFYGSPVSFDLNVNGTYRKVLTLGISYRHRESLDLLLKAKVTAQLQLGYAYDHSVGNVSRISNGSHELMINYLFRYLKHNVSSPR